MIEFDPDELLELLAEIAEHEGLTVRLDRETMLAGLAEARLLEKRPEHGPAALLYAFARRSARLGQAAQPFTRGLVHAQAAAILCELDINEAELAILYTRIVIGKIEFPELRGWVAARLFPAGQRPDRPPPKRPR